MRALLNKTKKLELVDDLSEPDHEPGKVKVRVHFTTLMQSDLDIAEGHYDFFLSLYGAKSALVRTGLEFSGTVLENSRRFKKGDRVFGYTHLMKGPKTHQEILSIDEDYVALMPEGMPFASAAGVPVAAQTSLVAWQNIAGLKRGDRVLINGGSGGVGVYAIQLAKHLGAHVTAIAGPDGQELMRQLGADQTFNYRDTKLETLDQTIDVIFDLTCELRFKTVRHLLSSHGLFIPADPLKNLGDFIGNPFRKQKTGYLMVDRGDHVRLSKLSGMFEAGELQAPDSLLFDIADFQNASEALLRPGKPGRIILSFNNEV